MLAYNEKPQGWNGIYYNYMQKHGWLLQTKCLVKEFRPYGSTYIKFQK